MSEIFGGGRKASTGFQMSELLWLLGFVIISIIALGIFLSLGEGIGGFLNCGESPPAYAFWCHSRTTTEDDIAAYQSVRALSCAISAVATGSGAKDPCIATAAKPVTIPQGSSPFPIGLATPGGKIGEPLQNKLDIVCTAGNAPACTVKSFRLPERFGGVTDKPAEYISGYGDPSYLMYYQNFPLGEDAGWASFKTKTEGAFQVILWAIPAGQIVSKGGKFLWKLAAAPFQPIKSTKSTKAAIGAIKEFMEKRVAKSAAKALGEKIAESEENILVATGATAAAKSSWYFNIFKTRINKKILERYKSAEGFLFNVKPEYRGSKIILIPDDGGGIAREEFKKQIQAAFEFAKKSEIDEQATTKTLDLFRYLSKEEQEAVANEVFRDVGRQAAVKAALAEGVGGAAAYLASLAECDEFQAEKHPGSLILQKPLSCKEGQAITDIRPRGLEIKTDEIDLEKPVVLRKPSFKDANTPLYFASPCHADVTVTQQKIGCDTYVSTKDGIVQCESPDTTPASDLPTCSLSKDVFPGESSSTFFAVFNGLLKAQDKRIFESVPGAASQTVATSRTFFPFQGRFLQPGTPIWTTLEKTGVAGGAGLETFDDVGGGVTYFNEYTHGDVYEGTLRIGETVPYTLKGVSKADDILMASGVEYVLDIYAINEAGAGDDIVIDVYPTGFCGQGDEISDSLDRGPTGFLAGVAGKYHYRSCSLIAAVYGPPISTAQQIRDIVRQMDDDTNEVGVLVKFVPATEIKAADLVIQDDFSFGSLNSYPPETSEKGLYGTDPSICGDSLFSDLQCFRTLRPATIRMFCSYIRGSEPESFTTTPQYIPDDPAQIASIPEGELRWWCRSLPADASNPGLVGFSGAVVSPDLQVAQLEFLGDHEKQFFLQKLRFFSGSGAYGPALTLKDSDFNGVWDNAELLFPNGRFISFDDTHENGAVDSFSMSSCAIEAIVVSPDLDPYENDDHNFCYTTNSWSGIILYGAAVAATAGASVLTSGWTLILSEIFIGASAGGLDYYFEVSQEWPG